MDELCWLNGTFLPLKEARVSATDRGFNFADGVYEVFRVYHGKIFQSEAHFQRLLRSCEGIELSPAHSIEQLNSIANELIERSGFQESMIYLQITRGSAPRYHSFPKDAPPTVFLSIKPLPAPIASGSAPGQKLVTVTDERWLRCWIKSIALLPNILAKRAADLAGADEAIFIEGSTVHEGATSNLFIIKKGKLFTPPEGPKILSGITRKVVIEAARQINLPVAEVKISLAGLVDADEVFITSTTREIAWVESIDGKTITTECGPIALRLHQAFQSMY